MLLNSNENNNFPLSKFESMLKTNNVYFFDSEDFEHIIHHYLDIGKMALAKKAIKIGLEQHPASVELKLLRVEVLIFDNNLLEAEHLLDEIQEIEQSNEEIYIQRANILSKQDQHQKAIDFLNIALNITDDAADVLSLIGMEYLFLENYKDAKENFIKCLEIDPEDYTSLYNTIYCFDCLEDSNGAIAFLNIYIEGNPYCEVAWHQLGKQYVQKKMYKEALTAFDFAIISDDTFVGAYLEKAKILEKTQRYVEAIEQYKITLELDDPTSFALLRIGKCFEKIKNYDEAKNFYHKTVHEDPLLDKGWLAITDFYIRKKNYAKALYYINKAISIDPDNVLYWKRSAQINKKLNLLEEADIAYQKTVELGNYELNTWLSWADILQLLGEHNTAINTLQQALEFYPTHAKIEYRLAGLYFLCNTPKKGIFHLKNALKNNYNQHKIIKLKFPNIFKNTSIKNIITNFKNTSI